MFESIQSRKSAICSYRAALPAYSGNWWTRMPMSLQPQLINLTKPTSFSGGIGGNNLYPSPTRITLRAMFVFALGRGRSGTPFAGNSIGAIFLAFCEAQKLTIWILYLPFPCRFGSRGIWQDIGPSGNVELFSSSSARVTSYFTTEPFIRLLPEVNDPAFWGNIHDLNW